MKPDIAALKIGDTLFHFSSNHRVYGDNGRTGYADHFVPYKITGQNRVSWIVGTDQFKVSKKDLACKPAWQFGGRGFFTKVGMADDIWNHEHRYKLARAVESAPTDQLRAIAKLIGYEE